MDMDVQLNTQTEHSYTECPVTVLLRLTVFWTIRSGRKSDITFSFTWIGLIRLCSWILSWTPRSVNTMIVCVWFSCMLIVSPFLWLLSEESDRFRFRCTTCLTNLQGSVVLILVKTSVMRVTIPLNFSTSSFIPLPRFIHSRPTPSLLTPSLVLFPQHSAQVTHDVRSFCKLHRFHCVS